MILVTGASGFVGNALVKRLSTENSSYNVVATLRNSGFAYTKGVKTIHVGDISSSTIWDMALQGVSTVVHCAARVHLMSDKSSNPLAEFRKVNVEGTANLACQAVAAGVRRFIYMSSIKVNGEFTELGRPFTADDVPAPKDPYGVSKYEAEQALRKIAIETSMEIVIIRPPLVYGPGVKANFETLMRWLVYRVPLPLRAVTDNYRSLVSLDNLIDLIVICINHQAAVNQTFLVSDGEDLSTAELLTRMGRALGFPARLFYLPTVLLKLGAMALNKPSVYQRLCGSLQLDITKTRELLGWSPLVCVDEGLRRAAEGFH